jgi:hypothetical protein
MYECDLEEFVPIPTRSGKLYSDVRTRARAALEAAALLVNEGYDVPEQSVDELRSGAKDVLNGLGDPRVAPTDLAAKAAAVTSTPEGARYLNAMLAEYDMDVVENAARLRNYVVNKLLLESASGDARIRIKALELLGKVSDVALFTERSEVTITSRSTVELESSLRDKIAKLMNPPDVSDATYTQPIVLEKPIDVNSALGG